MQTPQRGKVRQEVQDLVNKLARETSYTIEVGQINATKWAVILTPRDGAVATLSYEGKTLRECSAFLLGLLVGLREGRGEVQFLVPSGKAPIPVKK